MRQWGFLFILAVFLLFSCGFLEEAQFQSRGSGTGGEGSSGRGRVPDLSKRISSSPRISKNRCKESESCRQVCEDLYNNLGSYRNCYDLSIGEVSDMQELVDALTEADEQEDLPEQIKGKTVALYIEAGLDGFNEEVMGVIDDFKDNEKKEAYQTILHWIANNKDIAEAFREEDTDHETLRNLLLNHKESLSALEDCKNTRADASSCRAVGNNPYSICTHHCTTKEIHLNSQNELSTNVSSDETVSIESSQKNLLIALSATDGGDYKNFFHSSEGQPEAFALGHSLLEEACTNDNDDDEADLCMARFYCWLGGSTLSSTETTTALNKIKSEVPRQVRNKVKADCVTPTP